MPQSVFANRFRVNVSDATTTIAFQEERDNVMFEEHPAVSMSNQAAIELVNLIGRLLAEQEQKIKLARMASAKSKIIQPEGR